MNPRNIARDFVTAVTEGIEGNQPTIGLALSGGGPRGIAHVGILKAFEEHQVVPNFISGTSIGALVGSAYAFGAEIDSIRKKAEAMSWSNISKITLSKNGLLSNRVIGEVMKGLAGDVNIENSPIPLAIIATDIENGDKIILNKGNLARAVMASTCVPGVYIPHDIDGRLLVDGFLVENVPVSPLVTFGADIKIAVSLGIPNRYREPNGIINIMMNAFEIAVDSNTRSWLRNADIVITPDIHSIDLAEGEEAGAMYQAGYEAGSKIIPELRQKIRTWQQNKPQPLWKQLLRRVFSTSARSAILTTRDS